MRCYPAAQGYCQRRERRALGSLLVTIGLLTGNPATSAEENSLTWAVVELPPIIILTVPNPASLADLGNGSTDVALRAIATHLPGYQHKVVSTSATRVIADMVAGKPLCVPAVVPSPELARAVYLTSRGITPPSYLVIRKNDMARITRGAKSVSLEKLLQRKDLVGMIDAKRPQGRGIDELIAKPQKQLKLATFTHFTTIYSSLMKNIDTGEVDYTLELPYVMEYYNRKKIFLNELVAIPLDEAAAPNTVYVACTRSPWGARVIRDIDAAIRAAISEDKGVISKLSNQGIRQALLYWLPETLQAEYASRLDDYFKQRLTEAPPVTE